METLLAIAPVSQTSAKQKELTTKLALGFQLTKSLSRQILPAFQQAFINNPETKQLSLEFI